MKVSFIFWLEFKSERFNHFLRDLFEFNTDTYQFHENKKNQNKEEDPLWLLLKNKLRKHVGFVIEATIEAFPQSMLQMIAMIFYEEVSALNAISVIISMISASSKSLMFAYHQHKPTFLFGWISMVFDFFTIFTILSWVFYNPNNPGQISTIGLLWVYKTFGAFLAGVWGSWAFWRYEIEPIYKYNSSKSQTRRDLIKENAGPWETRFTFCCGFITYWSFNTFVFIGSCIVASMLCEIFILSFIIIYFNQMKSNQSFYCTNYQVWKNYFDWLMSYKNEKDYQRKLIITNRLLCNEISSSIPTTTKQWLLDLEKNHWDQMLNLKISQFRDHLNKHRSYGHSRSQLQYAQYAFTQLIRQVKTKWNNYQASHTSSLWYRFCDFSLFFHWFTAAFIVGPIYFISRLISLFFPFVAFIYHVFFTNHQIQLLQWILSGIYFFLIISLIYIAPKVWKYHHATGNVFSNINSHNFATCCQWYYQMIDDTQQRQIIIQKHFGDISTIILQYLDPMCIQDDKNPFQLSSRTH